MPEDNVQNVKDIREPAHYWTGSAIELEIKWRELDLRLNRLFSKLWRVLLISALKLLRL